MTMDFYDVAMEYPQGPPQPVNAEYADTLRERMAKDIDNTLMKHGVWSHHDWKTPEADALVDELVEDGMHAVEKVIARLSD